MSPSLNSTNLELVGHFEKNNNKKGGKLSMDNYGVWLVIPIEFIVQWLYHSRAWRTENTALGSRM